MKKIACITVIHTPNYGSVLQAYALQEACKRLGYDYEILNYKNYAQEAKFVFHGKSEYMSMAYRIAKKILAPYRFYEKRKILAFHDSMLIFSRRYEDFDELKSLCGVYDAFIVGSDQVWNNQEINHFDSAYFLSFSCNCKKNISYAASFGKTIYMLSNADIDFYKINISKIGHISCREEEGCEIVENLSGRNSDLVCDPVFLLTADDWSQIAQVNNTSDYILVYLVGDGLNNDIIPATIACAKRLAKKNGLSVKIVNIGLRSMFKSFFKPTVPEFIGLIKRARFVISNSFHGTAFSIIFQKPFFAVVKGDSNNRMNTRIYGILKHFSLEARIIDISKLASVELLPLNYLNSEDTIKNFVDYSYDWLSSALNVATAESWGGVAETYCNCAPHYHNGRCA